MTASTSNPSTLPSNPIAALLLHGAGALDTAEMAARITSGQWPIDPHFTHDDQNLIELLASNKELVAHAQGALDLVAALANAGVVIGQDAWKRVNMHAGPSVALMLRCCSEGVDVDTAHLACAALNRIAPFTPVIEQSQQALEAVKEAGGWGKQIQGISLACWLAAHDDYLNRGGYTQRQGLTEGDQKSFARVRNRVFDDALKTHGQWSANTLDKVMLYCRTSQRDTYGDATKSLNITPGDVSLALDDLTDVPPRVQTLVAARLCDAYMPKVANKPPGSAGYVVEPDKVAQHHDEAMKALQCMLAHSVNIGIAGGDLLGAMLRSDPSALSQLPANAQSVKRVVDTLLGLDNSDESNLGKMVRQWLSHDPQLQVLALEQTHQYMKARGAGANTPANRMARYEAFILSLGVNDVSPQAPSRRQPRL